MEALETWKCPNCNAPLKNPDGRDSISCPYCGASIIVPENLRANTLQEPSFSYEFSPTVFQLPPDVEAQIRALIADSNKIEAIRVYRANADTSLKEAKEAIEAWMNTGVLQNVHVSKPKTGFTFQESGIIYEVAQLVRQGERSRAEDAYRRGLKTSHAEAKAVVSALYRQQDADPQQVAFQARQKALEGAALGLGIALPALFGGGGCAVSAFVVSILVLVAGVVLFAFTLPGGPLHSFWSRIDPTAYGNLALSFGGEGTGPGLFSDARSIAISSDDDVYVGDYQDGRIQRFNERGELQNLWQISKDRYLQKLAVDRNGVVYALYSGEIWKYDGKTGKYLGQVDNPEDFYYEDVGMTAEGGWVAVKDSEDLVRFDSEWNVVWMVEDVISTVTDDSTSGARLAVDGLGNIYLIATFHYAVFKYSPEGKYLNRWGEEGDGAGQFRALLDIAVDRYGQIFVSDASGIFIFTSEGRLLDTIPLTGVAYGLAFDSGNNLWFTSSYKKVQKYSIRNP